MWQTLARALPASLMSQEEARPSASSPQWLPLIIRVMQFYYHPDHLGSSSYITNLDGEVVQHIEYVPFGEVFVEERNNISNNPLRRQRNGKR